MSKFEIRIGDRVRSYDFTDESGFGDSRYYIEGIVMAMGWLDEFADCPRYKIKVEHAVDNGGTYTPTAKFIYPPMNGTPTVSGKYCFGVERL